MKQALDTQAEWTRTWMQTMLRQGPTQNAQDTSQQSQELLQTWTATQTQLWESWFGTVRQVLDLSEQMLRQTLETQAQMMQALTKQAAEASEATQGKK